MITSTAYGGKGMVLDKKELNQILSDQNLYEKDGVKISENNIDSFELISVLSQIEESMGIEIDIEKLNISRDMKSLDTLYGFISENSKKQNNNNKNYYLI